MAYHEALMVSDCIPYIDKFHEGNRCNAPTRKLDLPLAVRLNQEFQKGNDNCWSYFQIIRNSEHCVTHQITRISLGSLSIRLDGLSYDREVAKLRCSGASQTVIHNWKQWRWCSLRPILNICIYWQTFSKLGIRHQTAVSTLTWVPTLTDATYMHHLWNMFDVPRIYIYIYIYIVRN